MSRAGHKYSPVRPNPLTSADDQSEMDLTDADAVDHNEIKRMTDIKTPRDFLAWITYKPTTKLPFLYFIAAFIISIVLGVYYPMNNATSFMIAGIFGIIVCFYGMRHFKVLLDLKQEIDKFFALNLSFKKENEQLKAEVERITAARESLTKVHSQLQKHHEKLLQNNIKFRTIQENMKAVNLDNIKGIHKVRSKANNIGRKWKDQLLGKEREVICRVYERIEETAKREGITKEHFDELAGMLPLGYRERFDRLGTFSKLAAGKSVIECQDFEMCLDVFAEMNVDDCDIEFEIEKKPSNHPSVDETKAQSPQHLQEPQYIKSVSILRRSSPGTTLSRHKMDLYG